MPAARKGSSTRRRTAGRGKGKSSSSSVAISGVIITVLAIAAVIAFLRINQLDSLSDVWLWLQGRGSEVSAQYQRSVNSRVSSSCNVISDKDCLYSTNDDTASSSTGSTGLSGSSSTGSSSTSGDSSSSSTGGSWTRRANALPVSDSGSSSGYSIALFPHWETVSGTCDVMDEVFRAAGAIINKSTCAATSISDYVDPYTGSSTSRISDLTTDYVIPLKYAWAHGASKWSVSQRRKFANDRSNILVVLASSASSRGGKSPESWMASDTRQCAYAERWVEVAESYGLTVTTRDRISLTDALKTCG